MKKIFTTSLLLAAAILPTVSASAIDYKTPVLAPSAEALIALPQILSGIFTDRPGDEPVAPIAATDDISGDTWTSLGEGSFTDVFVSAIYSVETGPWVVEIMQSNEHPGYYRVVEPYGAGWGYYNNGAYRVRDDETYLTFDATDPTAVKVITTEAYNSVYGYAPLNVQISETYGEFCLFDLGGPRKSYGSMSGGNIIIPSSAMYVYLKAQGLYYTAGDLKISLPGAKDNSVEITVEQNCYADNQIPYTITAGADVTHIKTCVAAGARYSTSASNNSFALKYGYEDTAGSHVLNCDTASTVTTKTGKIGDGWLTLFAVTYDDSGSLLEASAAHAFATIHNDAEWRNLGKTKFTDDTFAYPFLGEKTAPAEEKEVEILQNIADPTKFRIVNAFATSSFSTFDPSTMYDGYTNAHNHYTDIVIARADSVVIPERPMGLTIDGYKLSLYNLSNGTLTGRNVTFPTDGLLVYNGSGSYYANRLGGFNLFIPRYDVVVTVTDGGEPVVGGKVTIGDATATTDEQGKATVSTYALSGTVEVTALNAGNTREGSATFTVEDGNYDYAVDLALTQASALDKVVAPTEQKDNTIYDLNGRRVSNPANNYIYIVGGKKTIIAK